jgi:hypothetical protein
VGPAEFFDRRNRKSKSTGRAVTYFENDWNFWLYPAVPAPPLSPTAASNIRVTRSWQDAEAALARGGKVLFVPRNSDLDWTSPPLDNVPVFWNRFMGPAWGRMLGLLIDKSAAQLKSRALADFPTSAAFDWQWAQIIQNVRVVNLDHLPSKLEPIVWAIDDWNRNYKLGAIFECRVGEGKLLVSAFDVARENDPNPVARQLRYSLLRYMNSESFQPHVSVSTEQMRSVVFDTQIMKKLGAAAHADRHPANEAIDGDPNTFVTAGDPKAVSREQVEILINFPAPVAMSGLVLMPRQNHREHEGDIREYAIQESEDGREWHEVARGALLSTFEPQRIQFPKTITARYLKLISLSGFGPDKTTALAELAVIYTGPKLKEVGDGVIQYERNKSATPDIDEGPGPGKRSKPSPLPVRPKP